MKVITVVNNTIGQIWNVHAYLENLLDIGWIDNAQILVYTDGVVLNEWDILKNLYPTAEFFFYKGDLFTKNIMPVYLPILRPYALKQHFKRYSKLEKETIIYTDSDILWTNPPDLSKLSTDKCYVSSTVFPSDYLSHKYLSSKEKDVDENKREAYKKIDVVKRLGDIVGITKEEIESNYENCGGVQYILNGVNWEFWSKVMLDCLSIRVDLQNLNQQFMKGNNPNEREANGFQSWCSDLWAVFYNLIYKGHKVEAIKELDFAWATDNIKRLDEVAILHNAGVTSDCTLRIDTRDENGKRISIDAPAFFKGKYTHSTPFTDVPALEKVMNHPTSQEYCTYYYTEHLLNLQKKYSLNY